MTKVVRLALMGLLAVLVLAAAPASAQTPQQADQCLVGGWDYNGEIVLGANAGTLTLSIDAAGQADFTLDSKSLPNGLFTFTGTGAAQIAVGTVLDGKGSLLWTNFEFVGNAPIGPVPSQESSYSCNADALTVTVPSTITVEPRPLTFARTGAPPTEYNLDVGTQGTGEGTVQSTTGAMRYPSDFVCPPTCSGSFWLALGEPAIRLVAEPEAGSWFMGWGEGNCTSAPGERECQPLDPGATSATATFGHELAIGGIVGRGSVTGATEDKPLIDGAGAPTIDCPSNCFGFFAQPAVLTAWPKDGYTFSNWSGCTNVTGPRTCVVPMTGDQRVTAKFNKAKKPGTCRLQHGDLPDARCTNGMWFPVTAEQVCGRGYSRSVRSVSSGLADAVYAEYGIRRHSPGEDRRNPDKGIGPYEIDHLIPLALGGSNSILNLWPQPREPFPGYAAKDYLETRLHNEVCLHLQDPARGMSLARARYLMLHAYRPV